MIETCCRLNKTFEFLGRKHYFHIPWLQRISWNSHFPPQSSCWPLKKKPGRRKEKKRRKENRRRNGASSREYGISGKKAINRIPFLSGFRHKGSEVGTEDYHECVLCLPGTYTNYYGHMKPECIMCPTGTFQPLPGQSYCKSCENMVPPGSPNCKCPGYLKFDMPEYCVGRRLISFQFLVAYIDWICLEHFHVGNNLGFSGLVWEIRLLLFVITFTEPQTLPKQCSTIECIITKLGKYFSKSCEEERKSYFQKFTQWSPHVLVYEFWFIE